MLLRPVETQRQLTGNGWPRAQGVEDAAQRLLLIPSRDAKHAAVGARKVQHRRRESQHHEQLLVY